jgi:GNAT superfamily N-acetyltransferase
MGQPALAEGAARLIRSTDPAHYDRLFDGNALQALQQGWEGTTGIYSHRHASVLLCKGEIIGLELGFPSRYIADLERETLAGLAGLPALRHALAWKAQPVVQPSSYYLHALAVAASFRGKGTGSLLLETAIMRAKAAAQRAIVLDAVAHARCIPFYERHGLRVISRTMMEPLSGGVENLRFRLGLQD